MSRATAEIFTIGRTNEPLTQKVTSKARTRQPSAKPINIFDKAAVSLVASTWLVVNNNTQRCPPGNGIMLSEPTCSTPLVALYGKRSRSPDSVTFLNPLRS